MKSFLCFFRFSSACKGTTWSVVLYSITAAAASREQHWREASQAFYRVSMVYSNMQATANAGIAPTRHVLVTFHRVVPVDIITTIPHTSKFRKTLLKWRHFVKRSRSKSDDSSENACRIFCHVFKDSEYNASWTLSNHPLLMNWSPLTLSVNLRIHTIIMFSLNERAVSETTENLNKPRRQQ